jgi:phosphate transport system substrate-binding protein
MTPVRARNTTIAVAVAFVVGQLARIPSSLGAPGQGQDAALPFTTISGADPNEAHSLTAKGGTFPEKLYKTWFSAYERNVGVKVDYQAVGSGAGIKSISNRHCDFAGSDAPMTDVELNEAKGGPIWHIPTAFGAIALVYNIPGFEGTLRLTAQDITGIYLGEITHWYDPRLVADNPQLAKITQEIIAVHRSDGSGSTYGFTDYLSANSALWRIHSRKGTSSYWPMGIGGRGGAGLVDVVKGNPFSIGYAEVGVARKNNLPVALVKNSAGQFVAPDAGGIAAAAAASGQKASPDLRFSVVNAPGAASYPICTGTWLLVYRNMKDRATAVAVTRMLWWAIHDGQAANIELGYARLPAALVGRAEQMIREINVLGQPAFPGH